MVPIIAKEGFEALRGQTCACHPRAVPACCANKVISIPVRSVLFSPRNDKERVSNMALRLAKTAIVLLLGFLLSAQGVLPVSPQTGLRRATCKCHHDCNACPTPACCGVSNGPSTPISPAPVPFAPQVEWQALAAPATAFFVPVPPCMGGICPPASTVTKVTTVPIFERDCAFLL